MTKIGGKRVLKDGKNVTPNPVGSGSTTIERVLFF
jgi:hypothetical protein